MMTSAKPASAATARAPDAGKPGGRTSGEPATTENQNIISSLDVQLVQNLVERCLQLYMNEREVVALLQQQTKIEPSFTSLVWQKLEEQNPDFFFSYDVKLRLKDQIVAFNYLVEQQYRLLQKLTLAVPGQQAAARPRPRRTAAAPKTAACAPRLAAAGSRR